jgi:hypothetical protein
MSSVLNVTYTVLAFLSAGELGRWRDIRHADVVAVEKAGRQERDMQICRGSTASELQVLRIAIVVDADHQFGLAVTADDDLPLPAHCKIDCVQRPGLTMGRFENDHCVAQPANVGLFVRVLIRRAPDQRVCVGPEKLFQFTALLGTQRTIAASRTPL